MSDLSAGHQGALQAQLVLQEQELVQDPGPSSYVRDGVPQVEPVPAAVESVSSLPAAPLSPLAAPQQAGNEDNIADPGPNDEPYAENAYESDTESWRSGDCPLDCSSSDMERSMELPEREATTRPVDADSGPPDQADAVPGAQGPATARVSDNDVSPCPDAAAAANQADEAPGQAVRLWGSRTDEDPLGTHIWLLYSAAVQPALPSVFARATAHRPTPWECMHATYLVKFSHGRFIKRDCSRPDRRTL
jgi:hypothetical protein